MMSRNDLLRRGRDAVNAISSCEACDVHRRPRIYVCCYHDGWLDGIEHAQDSGRSSSTDFPQETQEPGA